MILEMNWDNFNISIKKFPFSSFYYSHRECIGRGWILICLELVIDRDCNAAINIKEERLRKINGIKDKQTITVGYAGIACLCPSY